MEDKEIAKEILITMIEKDAILRREFPGTKNTVDLMCEAYKTILKTIKED